MNFYGIKISGSDYQSIERNIMRTYPDVKYFDVIVDALDIKYLFFTSEFFGINLDKIRLEKREQYWERLKFFVRDIPPQEPQTRSICDEL